MAQSRTRCETFAATAHVWQCAIRIRSELRAAEIAIHGAHNRPRSFALFVQNTTGDFQTILIICGRTFSM